MTNQHPSTLIRLLESGPSGTAVQALLRSLHLAPMLLTDTGSEVSRAVIAAALNVLLF